MITYYAYDVETANYSYSSICQIGIVKFADGVPVQTWNFLVNPGSDWFCFSGIHGITYDDVKDAPLFPEIYNEVKNIVGDNIVIHHTPFDIYSTRTACEAYNLPPFDFSRWIDSAKIVRRTFTEFEKSGYGLANVANHLNIEFLHHNAAEDARAAGLIAWECTKTKDINFNEWGELVTQPIHPIDKKSFDQPNPDGDLYGEGITFTGTLSIPRTTAFALALNAGCTICESVTKKTSILVVGIQDRINGQKSNKEKKAEQLIEKGQIIRIVEEETFFRLISK